MANTTMSPFQPIENCLATNKALYKFYAAITIVIFILALPLNASVLHLFIFKLKFWKSNTNNIFLFNLVLADILLLFCLPIKAHNFIRGERRSEDDIVCRPMLFMLFLNRGASIAFLTVTSIDRYFNVVHPGRKNLLRALKKSPQISIVIWLLLLPLTIPTMLKNFDCCNSHKNFASEDDAVIKVMFTYWMCNLCRLSVGFSLQSLFCYWDSARDGWNEKKLLSIYATSDSSPNCPSVLFCCYFVRACSWLMFFTVTCDHVATQCWVSKFWCHCLSHLRNTQFTQNTFFFA